MSDWQPIETAPKDGTDIIVYRPKHDGYYIPKVGVDHWSVKLTGYPDGTWARSRRDTPPTHWQPMPDPPLTASSLRDACEKVLIGGTKAVRKTHSGRSA